MKASKYNQYTELADGSYAIFNPLSGAFDLTDLPGLQAWQAGTPRDQAEKETWFARGYYFEDNGQETLYTLERYQDFKNAMQENQLQFMLVLSYACNFNCVYCYQKGIQSKELITLEMLDAFINFVIAERKRQNKEVIVTLFGGEPLLLGQAQEKLLEHLITQLNLNKIPLTVVTNGYNLKHYLPLLSQADLREIHVTFDGDRPSHDRRRITKDGHKSFDQITEGVNEAIKLGLPINARIIVDKKNIQTLPYLAEVFRIFGWLDLPKEKFKVALGRNYELIADYVFPQDLFSLDGMVQAYTQLLVTHPILQKMYIPDYFGISKMVNTGEMYTPSFDTCPAAKSEYVCDASGRIFGCTASCGREGYALGTYFPKVNWDTAARDSWKKRSILTIAKCQNCSVGVVCGGGCGVIAKDQAGEVLAPNCKPVKEVMDVGIRYYADKLKELAGV